MGEITAAAPRPRSFAKRHPAVTLWLAFTALFVLLAGVWIAIFAANGKSFIWYADGIKQHYPALVYYGRWLREAARCLVSGAPIPTWDMSIGYGNDIVTTLSYYVMGDPLNLLAAFVPSQYGEQLLEFLMLLRVYLAGLAFMPFSLHHKNSRFGTLLGAVAYAFSAWTLQTALTEPFFIIPMYCFPLVLLGADHIFEGRRPILYIAAIALAALSNFLFFYMIALLLVLYAVVKYFRTYGVGQLRTLWPLAGKFVGFSLVGIAIAAVTMLPTAMFMFGSARFSLDRQVTSYPFTMYWNLIANLTTAGKVDEYSTYCGISAVAILAVMILFARRRQNTVLKAAWLVFLAMLMTPWAGKILNGFSYMQNRWVWAFAMLEAFILARVCPDMTRLTGREKLTLSALLAVYCALAFWNRDVRSEWSLLGAALMLLLAVFVLSGDAAGRKVTRGVLLAGCCLGVVINIGYMFGVDESEMLVEYHSPGFAWEANVQNNPTNLLKQLDDDSLWRYDTSMNVYVNSAMLMDLHGVSYFFSLNNGYVSQWMAELGYNTPEEYNYVGLHGRSVMDALLGVKYFLTGTDATNTMPHGYDTQPVLAMDVAGVNVGAYPSGDALPIGYTSTARIDRADYEALTPVQRQDALLNGVLLEEGDGESLAPASDAGDVVIPDAEVTLNGVEKLDDNTYYSPKDGGSIVFTIPQPVQNAETYLVVEGMDYTATNPMDAMTQEELDALAPADRLAMEKQYAHFWCKEKVYLNLVSDIGSGRIDYAMRNNQYYCGRHDFAYNFGYTEQGMTTLTVVLPYAGYYTFDRIDVECQTFDTVAARSDALAAESLQNTVLGTNSLTGEITVSEPKVLVIQIPYSEGWSATVDGQPAELLRANTAFLGLELEPGSHTIELRYRTPGLAAGVFITIAGVLAFAGVAVFYRRRTVKVPAPKGGWSCGHPAA